VSFISVLYDLSFIFKKIIIKQFKIKKIKL
jgi:hypothetical protein